MLSQSWRWRQNVSPKRWNLPTSSHGVNTQKTNTDIFRDVSTSNLIKGYISSRTYVLTSITSWSVTNCSECIHFAMIAKWSLIWKSVTNMRGGGGTAARYVKKKSFEYNSKENTSTSVFSKSSDFVARRHFAKNTFVLSLWLLEIKHRVFKFLISTLPN
jgi:hypothetical protein